MTIPTLDLHGYKTADVEDAVDRFLAKHISAGTARIRIMTGKGSGAVKQTVIQYLKLGKFPWVYEKVGAQKQTVNEGVLVVILE